MIGIYKIVMRVFISYSRDDKNYVYEFANALHDETRHEVWIDKRLVGADRWWDTILHEIETCDCFVTVLTPRCINSIYCSAELDYALTLQKPILPMLLKPCDGIMPSALQPIQFIDIETVTLEKAALRAAVALGRIELGIAQGHYAKLNTKPSRPPVPEAKANAPQHSWEIFAAAEEAAANPHQFALAERLFEQAIKADPKGIGVAATERLAEIRLERERDTAYQNVVRLAINPNTLKGAQAAWRAFVAQYGNVFPAPDGVIPPKIDFSKAVRDVIGGPFEWIDIPGGVVELEDDMGSFTIPDFAIAKYSVTNKQYQAFVDAKDGYANPKWWDYSEFAQAWRKDHPSPADTTFTGDELPRTDVCWYDAIAFCRWLEQRTQQKITLPTDQQWQRAAIGDTGWQYPWGNEPPDKDRCNFAQNVGQTTPVTQYPKGASLYGVLDMSGNVWEWCLTEWGTDSISINTNNTRVLQGCSWWVNDEDDLRATCRN